MSNLILIRGFEIDIPKTMLQHHITNVVDLEKHLKKLIKKRTNSFRLLVVRNNVPNINDQYKMYISHRYITKDKNNNKFSSDDRNNLRSFTAVFSDNTNWLYGRNKQFVDKFELNKQNFVTKNQYYGMFYDLYEEMYVF